MVEVRPARPYDTADIARIHIDMWRLAYDGILADEYLRGLSYTRSRVQWQVMLERHAGVLLVAESSDDGVVGFAAGGSARTSEFGVDGELAALYVLASHQGQGVGRDLTVEMARALHENGRSGMLVWVLADNPARDFYEHLGATEAGNQTIEIGDQGYVEVAYVWRDLSLLLP
jgi:ribosomal protein S18 acetylase RimI-like enzyme